MTAHDDDCEMQLAYPFVVCQSQGGPYPDDAFVAGVQLGQLIGELKHSRPIYHEATVMPALVPQIDLVAMHEGYSMTSEPWEAAPDDWAFVSLTRTAGEEATL